MSSPSYNVNVRGVVFHVSYSGSNWIIESSDFFKLVKKPRMVLNESFIRRVHKYLEGKGISVSYREIYDAFNRDFVSRVRIRVSVPVPSRVIYVRMPIDYNDEVNTAFALAYTTIHDGDDIRFDAVVFVSDGDNIRRYSLLEFINGVGYNGVVLRASSNFLKNLEGLDIDDASRSISSLIGKILEVSNGSIPSVEDVENWINIIRSNGDPFQLLSSLIRQLAEFTSRFIWRGFTDSERVIVSLIPSLGIIAPVLDFVLKVVFTSFSKGSGKSYHVGLLSSFLPYHIITDSATAAALSRIMDFVFSASVDEPSLADEALLSFIIRSFRRDSNRLIVDNNGNVTSFKQGSLILMPDLRGRLQEYDKDGAAISRSIILRIMPDRRIVSIRDSYKIFKNTALELTLGNFRGSVKVSELPAIMVAFYLLNARRIYELYNSLDEEVRRLASEGRLNIDGRRLQTFAPFIILARIAGGDFESKVWDYIRNYNEDSNNPLIIITEVVSYIVKNMSDLANHDGVFYNEVKDYIIGPSNNVLLIRPKGIRKALIHMNEDDERFSLPKPFDSEQNLSQFINTIPVLRKLYVKAMLSNKVKSPHLIISEKSIELLTAIREGRVDDALKITNEIIKDACTAFSSEVKNGSIELQCTEPTQDNSVNKPQSGNEAGGKQPNDVGQGVNSNSIQGGLQGDLRRVVSRSDVLAWVKGSRGGGGE